MSAIICPTIDLFLYDLRSSLDDSPEDIAKNLQYFQAKLHPSVQPQLLQLEERDWETEYRHLLGKPYYAPLEPNTTLERGYYYPVQLGDSYGLLLEYPHANQKEPQPPQCFRELKATIEQKLAGNMATLGQTWMLSAYLPTPQKDSEEREAEIKTIAQSCYQALMPDLNWDEELDGQGKFLGATIFELSRTRLSKQKLSINQQQSEIITQHQHVIIAIYPNQESFNQLSNFYTDWMRLFYYHHKIIWAYGQSRAITKLLKQEFSQIYTDMETVENKFSKNQELPKLKDILIKTQNKLGIYTVNLNKLNFQPGTIEINLNNYQKRLTKIIQKAQPKNHDTIETELSFFQGFSQTTQEKYLLQIKKDTENLQLGLRLLEDTINAVRSRVEVEKSERDKNFQDFISLVGVGWGAANICTQNVPLGKKDYDPFSIRNFFPEDTLANSLVPPIYSLGIAAIVIGGVLLWRRIWRR